MPNNSDTTSDFSEKFHSLSREEKQAVPLPPLVDFTGRDSSLGKLHRLHYKLMRPSRNITCMGLLPNEAPGVGKFIHPRKTIRQRNLIESARANNLTHELTSSQKGCHNAPEGEWLLKTISDSSLLPLDAGSESSTYTNARHELKHL